MGWAEVEQAFAEAIEREVIPGATLVVRRGGDIAYERAFGFRALTPERSPMRLETVFDLSSLTKPLATTVAAMLLVRDNKLRLDDRVTRFFHNFGTHGKGPVTFRHLLAHCSGMAAWRPFYQKVGEIERGGKVNFMASQGAKEFVYEEIHRDKPGRSRRGTGNLFRPQFHAAGGNRRADQRGRTQSLLPRQDLPSAGTALHRLH